jgi:membrane protein
MKGMRMENEREPVTMKSVWELIKLTFASWHAVNAPRLGAALAFYTILSLAPLLVVCISIAGFAFGKEAAQGQIVSQIQGLVGVDGARAIQAMLEHARQPSEGGAAAILGVLTLLFGASGVFGELRDSMNAVWGVKSTSGNGLIGMVRYRFVSFAMVLGIGFLLLVSLILSAFIAGAGKFLGGVLPLSEAVLHAGNTLVSFVSVTLLFALLYKFVPDIEIEWRDVWVGAAVTAALFTMAKFFIGLYLGKASIGSTYGAAGSLVILLVWVYYSAQIVFMGAEFTRNFAERHGSRATAQGRARDEITPAKPFRHPRLA